MQQFGSGFKIGKKNVKVSDSYLKKIRKESTRNSIKKIIREEIRRLISEKDIPKQSYLDLVNKFGSLITMNMSQLKQQAKKGYEDKVNTAIRVMNSPMINGMKYSDFISKHYNKLQDEKVVHGLLKVIYNGLNYLKSIISMLTDDAKFKEPYQQTVQMYKKIIS